MTDYYRQHWKSNETARYGLGGALIDPAAIPEVHYDVGGLDGDAAKLIALGKRIESVAQGIEKRWRDGLPDHYDAPEADQLVAGTGRVVAKAGKPNADLAAVGAALSTLASAVGTLQLKLDVLRAEATAFRAWALSLTSEAKFHGGAGVPKDWRTELYPAWNRTFGKDVNMSLCNQVGDALDGIMRAEEACVAAIESHTDTAALPMPSEIPPVREPGNGALRLDDARARPYDWRRLALTSGHDLPWGGWQSIPKHRIDIFTKLVAGILDSLVFSPVKFYAGLAGLGLVSAKDPMHRGQLGITFKAGTAKQTWAGVGRLMLAGAPGTYLDRGLRHQNVQTWKQLGLSFVASDEHDPWVRTGKVAGNIAGLFTPSPAKGVGLTHALERLAEAGGEAAKRGGWWRLAHAGELPKAVSEGAWVGADVRVGAKFGSPAIRDLADAVRSGFGRDGSNLTPRHLPPQPVHNPEAAVGHARQWSVDAQKSLGDAYYPERAALHDAKLRALRAAEMADHPAIERDFTDRLAALARQHQANLDAMLDEADRRILEAQRTGLPHHDPAAPPPVAAPAPTLSTSEFERIWTKLPEGARENLLDLVLWRTGPVDTASNLPGEYFWPQAPETQEFLGTPLGRTLDYLRLHPDIAIAEYLRQHPLVPAD
ncbi:hypothetical protein DFJ67_3151 [Asanoa ferruginea]|uniref:Uncharacterized protein n=1 Tax=Asanoa ferruginea TaxID=53367 RepID=A0A3D9ZKQ3_9ACTN|nr:hypothetical protein [Asanoa ferruginea]REF97154.1 hypothetical protein DFJ67_3151 [Asanoa ferruginea]GIF50104.1 hypothetical protein Afe04nite_46430 [Asanoa ferruginea]